MKRKFVKGTMPIVLIFIATYSVLCNAQEVELAPKWAHETSDLSPDDSVVFGKLKNGFRYALMENSTPENRISIHLSVNTGSWHETDAELGLAHFLEHLLFCGSTHFPPGELVKYFQRIGMEFGPDANARTSFLETVYDIFLPDPGKNSIQEALIVMKDYAEGALLLESEVERERQVILSEKRTRDSPSFRTFISALQFEFPNSRLAKRHPIGTEEVIRGADRSQFKSFYDAWYRPDNLVLIMVGNFDTQMAIPLIKETFDEMTPRAPARPVPPIDEITHQGLKTFYHYEKESGNTRVGIEVLEKIDKKLNASEFQIELFLKNVADRMVQYRLDTLLTKPGTPFTSANVVSGVYLKQIAYAEIFAECSPENWEKSLEVLEQTLRTALTFGFTQSELERAKRDFLSELDENVQKASTRESQDLASELIGSIMDDRVFRSPQQDKELFEPAIRALTLENAHNQFRESWRPDHRLIMVTGNATLPSDSPEDRIRASYLKSVSTSVSKPIETAGVTFPYLPEPQSMGRIKQKQEHSDLGIVQIDFENGIRLNLKKTDFQANTILFTLMFGTGRHTEPSDKSGLAELAETLINESGPGTISKDDLDRSLSGKKTEIRFNVDEESFAFNGSTVPEEIPLMFQLLYAYIMDPGFQNDAFAFVMERFQQMYQSLSTSVDGGMTLRGTRFLAGEDSRFGLPDYETFKKLSLDDVRSWLTPSFSNVPLELSVVGDFSPDAVIEYANRYFGSLPKRKPLTADPSNRLPSFPKGKSLEHEVDSKIQKGLVVIAFPTEDFWDIHRTRRLRVLASIFTDRLRERVREQLGAAYSLFAYNQGSRVYSGYGFLQAQIKIDPNQKDIVIREVKQIATDLTTGNISEDELRRSVDPAISSIRDMLRTNPYWLNTVLSGSVRYPQQLDWSRNILSDYASVTIEEQALLAKQYLNIKNAAVVSIVPVTPDAAKQKEAK